jgi:hypothetical protein
MTDISLLGIPGLTDEEIAAVEEAINPTIPPFVPPVSNPPPTDAPAATQHAWILNHAQQALRVRIAQLEHVLRANGLDVPPPCEGWA